MCILVYSMQGNTYSSIIAAVQLRIIYSYPLVDNLSVKHLRWSDLLKVLFVTMQCILTEL